MKISILGIGTWGTALGIHLHNNGHKVCIYGRLEDKTEEINQAKIHPFLPGVKIPEAIEITTDLQKAASNKYLVTAVPSPYIRNLLCEILKLSGGKTKNIINVAKGFEIETGKRISEIVAEVSSNVYRYCVFSGPTHAEEIAKKLPSAIVSASSDLDLAKIVQKIFNNTILRVYTSHDTLGVELGGAFKNVVAIAVGVIDGLSFGDNIKAALITRGLHEMKILGKALDAKDKTFDGLAGVGDLIVTCMSRHSRNRAFGEKIGLGYKSEEILNETSMVAEGVFATKAFYFLAKKYNLDLPITEEVYMIIYKGKDPRLSFKDLMNRKMKMESE